MTLKDARRRVNKIAEMAGDPEVAHSEEDDFRTDVLRAIAGIDLSASGARTARQLAREALSTGEIRFPRWCA